MADTPDPNEMILIRHPDVAAVGGPVTRQAFDEIHARKGWTEVKDDAPAGAPKVPTTTTQKGA